MLTRELELSLSLAREAGTIGLEVHDREFTVDQKQNREPVTEADRRINEFLVSRISEAFPDDLVVGEESTFEGGLDAERRWFIDPVDGTSDFIKKNGEWSVMIGLVVGDSPSVGVVFMPVTGDMYFAVRGEGAYHQMGSAKRRLRVSDSADAKDATVVRSRSHPDPRIDAVLERAKISKQYRHGSVGCKLAQIAEQRADLYFNFSGKCHMWDTCGPEVIIREAGGKLVDLTGNPISYRGTTTRVTAPFIASTSRLLPFMLETMDAMSDQLQPED